MKAASNMASGGWSAILLAAGQAPQAAAFALGLLLGCLAACACVRGLDAVQACWQSRHQEETTRWSKAIPSDGFDGRLMASKQAHLGLFGRAHRSDSIAVRRLLAIGIVCGGIDWCFGVLPTSKPHASVSNGPVADHRKIQSSILSLPHPSIEYITHLIPPQTQPRPRMGKAKRGKLSRRARHDPVGLPPSPAGATSAAGGGGLAGPDGRGAGKAHVLLQEVGAFTLDSIKERVGVV